MTTADKIAEVAELAKITFDHTIERVTEVLESRAAAHVRSAMRLESIGHKVDATGHRMIGIELKYIVEKLRAGEIDRLEVKP